MCRRFNSAPHHKALSFLTGLFLFLEAKLKRLTSSKRIIAFIQKYSPVVGGPDEPPVVSVSAKMDFL